MPHPEKNHRSAGSTTDRDYVQTHSLRTEQGKVLQVSDGRLIIKSPSLRVETHVTLTDAEALSLAELLVNNVQHANGQADHDDEVVT